MIVNVCSTWICLGWHGASIDHVEMFAHLLSGQIHCRDASLNINWSMSATPWFQHISTTVSGVQNHTKSKFEDVAHEPQISADAKFTLETRLLNQLLPGYPRVNWHRSGKKTQYNSPKETIAFPHLWKRWPSSQRLNRLVAVVTNKGEGHLSSAARARQGQRQALFFGYPRVI